jgi:hypothetical protein
MNIEAMRSIAERDRYPDCPHCDTDAYMIRPVEAPPVMFNAMVDGRLRSDSGFKSLQDAAKLEVRKANLPPDKRGDIQREINALRSHKK